MTKRFWIAFDWVAYLRDTRHLNTEQHGAYLLLLMECWEHGRIPLDDDGRAMIAKVSRARWRTHFKAAIDPYFKEDGTNKRASKEIEKAERVSVQRSIAGRTGGIKSGISRAIERGNAIKSEAKHEAKTKQMLKQTPSDRSSNCEATYNSKITTTFCEAAREGFPAKQGSLPSAATRADLENIYTSKRKATDGA